MNGEQQRQLRIFIVDDDPFFVEYTKTLLCAAGHQVDSTTDSSKALKGIEAYRPDCVLLDLMMPGSGGLQLIGELKNLAGLEYVKTIVVSAKSYEFDRLQALKSGADGFITKPIDDQVFVRQVERIVDDKIKLCFWGVRGTLPVASERARRYGGNTSCVTLEFSKGPLFVFDAGTGIKELSNALMKKQRRGIDAKILISHPHWDHINALPLFAPLYIPGNSFEILGAAQAQKSMEQLISEQMDDVYSPVTMNEFGAQIKFTDLTEEQFVIGSIGVRTMFLNHPGNCLGYRIEYKGRSICYVTDNELFTPDSDFYNQHYVDGLVNFVKGANVLITDCTYTDAEYETKIGWGHATTSQVAGFAHDASVKTLYLFHHDPDQDDDAIEAKLKSVQKMLADRGSATKCLAPSEGDILYI